MIRHPLIRSFVVAVVLVLGVMWALLSAKAPAAPATPRALRNTLRFAWSSLIIAVRSSSGSMMSAIAIAHS